MRLLRDLEHFVQMAACTHGDRLGAIQLFKGIRDADLVFACGKLEAHQRRGVDELIVDEDSGVACSD